jgi:hypothetical protein
MKNWNNFLRFILCFLTANALLILMLMAIALDIFLLSELIFILALMIYIFGLTFLVEFLAKVIAAKKRTRK